MPNKTIYIRDSDTEIWDKAQKELGGESISSAISDCLKQRLRAGSKTLDNVEAIKDLLAESNAEQALSLELHPFWSPVILDANTLDVGYKLHQRRSKPDRIMSLIVDPFNFAADGNLTAPARKQIPRAKPHRETWPREDCAIGFTFIAVHLGPNLPASGDDDALQHAIAQSEFTVQFDEGVLIDGSKLKVISGRYISLIRGRY